MKKIIMTSYLMAPFYQLRCSIATQDLNMMILIQSYAFQLPEYQNIIKKCFFIQKIQLFKVIYNFTTFF